MSIIRFFSAVYKQTIPLRLRVKLRHYLQSWRSVRYRGSAVHCVCCGGSFSSFAPFGAVVPRVAAACPRCDAMERQRFLYYYIQNHTNWLPSELKVLHFAPEICLAQRFRENKNWTYHTADILAGNADEVIDIQVIPYPADTFDLIFASHITSYIDNEAQALQELRRVLKPDGTLVLITRIFKHIDQSFNGGRVDTAEREALFELDPYVRWVHGTDYAAILLANGLPHKAMHWSNVVDELTARRLGFSTSVAAVSEGETLWLCQK